MSDWRAIDGPTMYPNECVTCGRKAGVVGPVIDTRRELQLHPQGFRIYICKQCAYLAAVTFQLVDSKKADERMDMGARLESAEREIKERDQIALNLSEEAEAAILARSEAEAQNEQLSTKLKQAQDALQAIGQDATAALGATVNV